MIRKTEKIFIVVILLLFCMKAFLHWMVSPVLIILLSAFSLYSAVLGVVLFNGIQNMSGQSFSTIQQWRIPVAIFLGMAVASIATGFEYKIFLWRGASPMLIIGIVILLLGLLLSGYFFFTKNDASFKSMFVRCACWLFFSLFFLLLPNNTLIDLYYQRYPDYARAFKSYVAHPDDSLAAKEWEYERAKLDSLPGK